MKLGLLPVLLTFFLMAPGARGELAGELSALIGDKTLAKATVGVRVVALGSTPSETKVLFEHNASTPIIPASNMKLLTTAAALDRLGAGFRFRTLLVKRGEDLILIGDGDPTFGDSELLKKSGWKTTTVFENWAQQLRKVGITRVRNVLVDDSVFDEVFFHPNWQLKSEQARYQAQVGGVSLNLNCVDVTVKSAGTGHPAPYFLNPPTRYVSVSSSAVGGGRNAVFLTRQHGTNQLIMRGTTPGAVEMSVTINDPPMFAGTVLAETLAAGGIEVKGKVMRDRTARGRVVSAKPDPGYALLAIHETPIEQVIRRANKDSVNLYAESLCKRLAHAETGQVGTWKGGTAAVGAYLKVLGADAKEFDLDDGSGLSRENAVSPGTISRVLEHHFHRPQRDLWVGSLAVAGEDGTLDNRFQNDLRGRVFAKTGYIDNVRALSGYLHAKNGQWYAFSILMNGSPLHGNSKTIQEQIVRAIDRNAGK